MKSRIQIRKLIGFICVFVLAFVISLFLYSRIQVWNGPILGIGIDENVPAALLSLLAAIYATFAYSIIVAKIAVSSRVFYIVLASYILVLGIVLFGKSVGISGYNFSFFQPNLISTETLLNIAVFAPVGFLLQLKLGKPRKTVLYGFCFVVIVEIVQFAFSLGIADVIDVAANIAGIAIGLSFFLLLERKGWTFVIRDGQVKFVRTRTNRLATWQKATVVAICCLLICTGFSLSISRDAQSEDIELLDLNVIPFLDIESDTLLKLNRADHGSHKLTSMRPQGSNFEFDYVGDSVEWLQAREDGAFSSEGTIDQVVAWLDEAGRGCLGLTVCCRELVDDIAVIHGLPIVITLETTATIDGTESGIEELRNRAYGLLTSYATCTYSIEDGWIHAEEISIETAITNLPDDIALFNYYRYDDYLDASENSQPFLKLANGQTEEVWGHLVSVTGLENGSTFCTIQFYDKLGTAPIVHSINVVCPEEAPSYPENTDSLSRLTLLLKDGELSLTD